MPLEALDDEGEAYRMRQRSRMYRIQELKDKLKNTEVAPYAEEMKEAALEGVGVTIASVSKAELEEQQRHVELAREREEKEKRRLHRRRQDILMRQEAESLELIERRAAELEAGRRKGEELRIARDRGRARALRDALRTAQGALVSAVKKRGASLRQRAGVLMTDQEGRGHLLHGHSKEWKLAAALADAPRPIKIRVDTIRVVRDKLPRGHYVVVATLMDRLGGKPITYSGSQEVDLIANEPLFLLAPPDAHLKASMCILLEVYQCKGRLCPYDKCVGWTAFPLVTAAFSVAAGKMKAPMLRGQVDSSVKLYRTLEKRYKLDLDNWLGNVYFKVSKMSRWLNHDKEYAVRMQYTSDLLGFDPTKEEQQQEAALNVLEAAPHHGPGGAPSRGGSTDVAAG
ncbi:hypothetical protein T484DRAFT_1920404, partial [Baffinella frigidus]